MERLDVDDMSEFEGGAASIRACWCRLNDRYWRVVAGCFEQPENCKQCLFIELRLVFSNGIGSSEAA